MRNCKRVLLIALFIGIIIGVNVVLNYVLIPYSYSRVKIHNIQENAYDDIIIGSSHGLSSIDPQVLDAATGGKSINLCLGGEYIMDSYYMLKKACEQSTPKRVVYELDPGYWCSEVNEDMEFARIYNEMPCSLTKLEYFGQKIMKADFRAGLFPWYSYRKLLKSIPDIIAEKRSDDYKNYGLEYFKSSSQYIKDNGFIYINTVENPEKTKDNLILWDEEKLNKDVIKYFDKLVDFCKKKKIELVVVTTPIPSETIAEHSTEFKEADKFFSEYMNTLGVEYHNFNYIDIEGMDRSINAFSDYEGHMFGETAQIFSKSLSQYLN